MSKPLSQDPNAYRWALEFCLMIKTNRGVQVDEDLMVGWFANAMMCQQDFHMLMFKRMPLWKRLWYAWKNYSW